MLKLHEKSGDDTIALMADIGRRARAAARPLAIATTTAKNAARTMSLGTPCNVPASKSGAEGGAPPVDVVNAAPRDSRAAAPVQSVRSFPRRRR